MGQDFLDRHYHYFRFGCSDQLCRDSGVRNKHAVLSAPRFTTNLYCICLSEHEICAGYWVLILDGNSEIGAHVRSDLGILIC